MKRNKDSFSQIAIDFAVAAIGAAVIFTGFIAFRVWADRTDIWNANSVSVYRMELYRMPDGGCAVQGNATMTKQDGGTTLEGTSLVQVAGANRVTCLDILDTKGPALFKVDKGL